MSNSKTLDQNSPDSSPSKKNSLSTECIDTLLGRAKELAPFPSSQNEHKRCFDLAGNPRVLLKASQRADGSIVCAWWMYKDLWYTHPKRDQTFGLIPRSHPYRIATIPGRGKGLLATKQLAAGDLILEELPIMVVPADFQCNYVNDAASEMDQAFNILSADSKREFMSLYDCMPESYGSKIQRIFATNCMRVIFPYSEYLPYYAAVYPIISRSNHSCSANSIRSFYPETLIMQLRAARPIAEGEEITNPYCDLTCNAETRQKSLLELYRFKCDCTTCSLPKAERQESDMRRKEIGTVVISETFAQKMWKTLRPEEVINIHRYILAEIDRENLHIYMYESVRWITRAYAVLGDKENLEIWAREAMSACRRSSSFMDRDSFKDRKDWAELLKDVTRHPEWNLKAILIATTTRIISADSNYGDS